MNLRMYIRMYGPTYASSTMSWHSGAKTKYTYRSTPNVLLTTYFHPQDISFKEVTDLLQQKTPRQYTYFYVNGSYIGDNYQWSQSPYNGATLTLPR